MSEIHAHFKTIDGTEWVLDSKESGDTWELISLSGAMRNRFDGLCVSFTKDKTQVTLMLEIDGTEYGLLLLTTAEYQTSLGAHFGKPNEHPSAELH